MPLTSKPSYGSILAREKVVEARQGHQALHYQLVKVEGRVCHRCSADTSLDLHRLVPGGEYVRDNVMVLCEECHTLVHYHGKFSVGDRVFLNGRTPAYVELARHRPRTVKAVSYDSQKQCNYYLLGSNAKGSCTDSSHDGFGSYLFRSYQLHPWQAQNGMGRPRTHRRNKGYTKHHLLENRAVLASH